MASSSDSQRYGFSDEDLLEVPTVFRGDLLAGRTVLVSGAGSGLGKAIATLCARLGANLAICGRDEDKLERTAKLLRTCGAEVLTEAMTIRDDAQVDRLMERVWNELGGLDALVNNAGGQYAQAAIDFAPKGWRAVIDTNLTGTWFMMQSAARRWIASGTDGSIVNIVADVWRGRPSVAHTCAARAGVIYLAKSVAVEWAPHRIRVNCVAPGVVETSAFELYSPEGLATYFDDANPLRHPGDAMDIAEGCVYLAADSGKFVTGEVLAVDGGQQLWGDPWPGGRPEYFEPRGDAAKGTDGAL